MQDALPPIEPGGIAIVGIAGRFPSARSPRELWRMLTDGREAAQWLDDDALRAAGVSEEELADPDYVRASLVLPDMEMFDADFFGFSKKEAAVLDPQHRHFLECSWEALEDAGHMPEDFDGAIGVFGGCGMQSYFSYNLLTNPQLVKSMGLFLLRHTGNDKDFLCSRVSYLLDLKGPSLSVQTACSTSLVAVHVASQSLLSGECDMALAGGVSIELPHGRGYRYAEGEILSPDGHCRAFDDDAAGTVFGSGAAVVVLRRLEDALRDGDNIYAVIRGSAVNNDGSGKAGYFAPSVDGQARAAVEALAVAGVEPATVQYIEAHGTGTPVGDPIEVAALTQAYGAGGKGFCGIGSIKTNIGHLDTAAGAAGLIKVALALKHERIPATLNFRRPNSRMDIANTPFQVVGQARDWPRGTQPRRAAVNSLGVGGTNAHVIVEEAPAVASAVVDDPQLLTFSARTPAALEQLKAKWLAWLDDAPPGFNLADAAFTLQAGRRRFDHRLAISARDVDGLREALQSRTHARAATGRASAEPPRVVFMFPGGGSHYPGAGRDLLTQHAFRDAVEECFRAMPADAPGNLREVMFDREANDAQAAACLARPSYAIPALFVLEYALARLWQSWGVQPAALVGHSAGEYAAACLAGVMSTADALKVCVVRGQLFECAPRGAMASVDLGEAEVLPLIADLALDIAVVNAPDLCTVSGTEEALARFEQRLEARGLEARRVHIAVAAHSRLLDDVLPRFREALAGIRLSAPRLPLVSNLTGRWADAALVTDREYWVRHLRETVRFAQGLSLLHEMPDAVLVEAGPGQGLCAVARQNMPGAQRLLLPSTGKAQEARDDLALMLASAGALWTRGVPLAWNALRGPGARRRISLPTYAFERQRHWIEPGVLQATGAVAAPPVAAPRRAQLQRLPQLADWFRVPQWQPAPLTGARSASGEWLVFGSASTFCEEVVAQVRAQGGRVTLVRRGPSFARDVREFAIAPANAEHYERVLRALEQEGALPQRILHLWPLDANSLADSGQALAFDSLLHLARAVQALDLSHPLQLVVASAGSACVHDEPVLHPERALALGAVRVIPSELPNVQARLVDLPAGLDAAAAASLVAEAATASPSTLAAWRHGERSVQQWASTPMQAASRLRDGGVYLITGGLGDIALDLAAWLARTRRAKIALVSRRSLPPKANWRGLAASGDHSPAVRMVRKLLALEDQGAQVLALGADVSDRRAMARAVGECRARFGAIHGVFHAAGVIEDAPIAAKTPESIQRVLGAKAQGAQVLHELFPPGTLDFLALFSSTSVVLGAAGQADYAAANAYLDALAASRDDGLVVRWGLWSDRGMAARAWGAHSPALEGAAAVHPLLGVQVDSDDGAAFEATYDARKLWVLDEHRVGGRPVLAGTAYVEIARAAMKALHPHAGVELRSLSFEEAMVFDGDSPRIVRTEMRRHANGYDFTVRSRGLREERWLEHAHASAAVLRGGAMALPASRARHWQAGAIPQEKAVDFGPRWRNIVRMQLEDGTATAELELPAAHAADLQAFDAHPALTDMAATFGLHLVDATVRASNLFVPLSIDRIRLLAPVPARVTSRVRLRSAQERLATFDVSLHGPHGETIASLEGFTLRAVAPEAVAQQSPAAQPGLVDEMLACGIRGEDAPALFEAVFNGAARDVMVSSIDIAQLRDAMERARPAAAQRKPRSAPAADAQLNPVESTIAAMWSELLGVEAVARDDDFFALGGHSLAAVRLFARIRKQFDADLPLATLFQAPTLAALAKLVAEQAGIATQPAEAAPRKSNVIPLVTRAWSPLVTICKGSEDRVPLFCVHGAGGNVLNFKVISDRLGAEQPFYGLQAQGVDGRLPPLGTIEEMAAQYVEAIRTVCPDGPYQLAGYSAGGVIALEMAHRLRREGARVSLLAMIDTLAPTAARRKVPAWRKLWLMRQWSLDFLLAWPGRRRKGKAADAAYAQALQRLARGEPLPPELVEHHLFHNFVDAQSRHTPQAWDGDMVLFKAELADTQYLGAGAALGWQEHVHGAIRVVQVPGSHFSMMSEPGVSHVIEGLREALGLVPTRATPLAAERASLFGSIVSMVKFRGRRPA